MRFHLPTIHQFSFWLGFVLATFLWWIISLIRPALKEFLTSIKTSVEKNKEKVKSVDAIEEHYRKVSLLQAQGMHLAAPLFALDEIIQEPHLLPPPARVEPGVQIQDEDIVQATLPYLPAWPELAAIYKLPCISVLEAVSGDQDILITGQAGMGKTVALAYLASCIARKDPCAGNLSNFLPFLVHVADLDNPFNRDNPLNAIIDLVAGKVPLLYVPRTPEFVKKVFSEGRALLLLDGADELSPEGLSGIAEYIKLIKKVFPKTRIVTTSTPDYWDGLIKLGFHPLAISAWTEEQQHNFIQGWAESWTDHVSKEAWAQGRYDQVDPLLLNNWIKDESHHLTPLELTLRTWDVFAGDLRGAHVTNVLETHLRRMKPANVPDQAVEILAAQVCLSGELIFDPKKGREWLKAFEPDEIPADQHQETQVKAQKKTTGSEKDAPAPGLISRLVNSGLLTQHRNNQIRFSHPVFLGLLASRGLGAARIETILAQQGWLGRTLTLQSLAAMGDVTAQVEKLLASDVLPLRQNLFTVAAWLGYAPRLASWRSVVMSKLAELLHQNNQALGLRGQAIAAFIEQSPDPSTGTFFRKLMEERDEELIQLAALGAGAIKDIKAVEPLSRLAYHGNIYIRRAACLALSAIGSTAAMDSLAEILLHGDENLRRIAAEALANNSGPGRELLKEGATLKSDFMVRRAVAYGLGRIHEAWATDLLKVLQMDDEQWIVRNSANEAMEASQRTRLRLPGRLPPPTESPWLIAYAGKQGMGVTPGKPPTELLLKAFRDGTLEEKLAALWYIRNIPTREIFETLFQSMHSDSPEIREGVYQALVDMATSGIKIPEPTDYHSPNN